MHYLNNTIDLTLVSAVDVRLKEAQFLSSKLQIFLDLLNFSKKLQPTIAKVSLNYMWSARKSQILVQSFLCSFSFRCKVFSIFCCPRVRSSSSSCSSPSSLSCTSYSSSLCSYPPCSFVFTFSSSSSGSALCRQLHGIKLVNILRPAPIMLEKLPIIL